MRDTVYGQNSKEKTLKGPMIMKLCTVRHSKKYRQHVVFKKSYQISGHWSASPYNRFGFLAGTTVTMIWRIPAQIIFMLLSNI
jgi:hypothetical protein